MNRTIIYNNESPDFSIKKLGKCAIKSPLNLNKTIGDCVANFTEDAHKALFNPIVIDGKDSGKAKDVTLELAGPREKIFFDPQKSKAAIVTCGGLCPGLNDVIRSIVMELWFHYQIRDIVGVRYGYRGLTIKNSSGNLKLIPSMVEDIQKQGGSYLGSSRGPQLPSDMVDFLVKEGINILFTIGGDGTQRGALEISKEILKRKLKISVVGIPKTIDNDIAYLDKTFGFETAASIAKEVLVSAHNEARGYLNGIGLVKLMGRHAGFIAARAALASGDANFVLVPEIPFELEGQNGFLPHLAKRIKRSRHALIVVAEGVGQDILERERAKLGEDPSGQKKLADIGMFLRDKINDYFKKKSDIEITLKYIDPSYIIRSSPANASDQVYCLELGQNAVHAAMTGRTEMIVGSWNNFLVHVPIATAISKRKTLDPEGTLWRSVIEATGQPALMINK